MQKERAANALDRGLPVPTPLPTRARGEGGSSSRPPPPRSDRGAPAPGGMPLLVKVLGVGLCVLGLVYGLTLLRDRGTSSGQAERAPGTAPASITTAAVK